jgi:hypothetical protein
MGNEGEQSQEKTPDKEKVIDGQPPVVVHPPKDKEGKEAKPGGQGLTTEHGPRLTIEPRGDRCRGGANEDQASKEQKHSHHQDPSLQAEHQWKYRLTLPSAEGKEPLGRWPSVP